MAFYCSGDKKIYFPRASVDRIARSHTVLAVMTIAHEMTHYAQDQSGMLISAFETDEPYLLQLRRIELQAFCSEHQAVLFNKQWQRHRSILLKFRWHASEDHGSAESLTRWIKRAQTSSSFSSCNTFTVGPEEVT